MPRSRKRGQRAGPAVTAAPAAPGPRERRSSEERNAEVRAELEPLAQGERPGAVTAAAIVATALAALVLAGYLAGARVGGRGTLGGAIALAAILLVAAWGMWRVRY